MKRNILEKPFESEMIRTRIGNMGKSLSYVEGPEYIRRLNEAFDGNWSFEIIEHHILEREVFVVGKLTAGDVTKMAFGGNTIRTGPDGMRVNIADSFKAASTDALKKACSLLGLGLHLYFDRSDEAGQTGQNGQNGQNGQKMPSVASTRGSYQLTEKQLNALYAMSKKIGWTKDDLKNYSIETYGVSPEDLTKSDASNFISDLQLQLAA